MTPEENFSDMEDQNRISYITSRSNINIHAKNKINGSSGLFYVEKNA